MKRIKHKVFVFTVEMDLTLSVAGVCLGQKRIFSKSQTPSSIKHAFGLRFFTKRILWIINAMPKNSLDSALSLLARAGCLLQKLLSWYKHWIVLWWSSQTAIMWEWHGIVFKKRFLSYTCVAIYFSSIIGSNNCLHATCFFRVVTRIDEI